MPAASYAVTLLAAVALFFAGTPSQGRAADIQHSARSAEHASRKEMVHRDVVPPGAVTRMKRNGMKMAAPKVPFGNPQTEGHSAANAPSSQKQSAPVKQKLD